MAINLRGKTWTIEFRPFGEKISLALKECEGKRQAAAIEAELKYALQAKVYDGLTGPARAACVKLFVNQKWEMPAELSPRAVQAPPKTFTLWDAVKLYTADSSYKSLSRTWNRDTKLAHLVSFFGKGRVMKEIWVADIKQFRTHRADQGKAPATINREVSALSSVFAVAIEHQILEINPCRHVKKLSEKSGQRRVYISFADVQNIMAKTPDWYQDLICFAYLTGMRQGEIHKLRWRHINLNTRIITFHETETKEEHFKSVPIHRELLPILDRMNKVRSLNDDRLFKTSDESLYLPWKRALDKLRWLSPRPRFHDLRHTWEANARRSGIDESIRKMIKGHADKKLSVTERYGCFFSDDELLIAIDKFTYDHGLTQILVASKAG